MHASGATENGVTPSEPQFQQSLISFWLLPFLCGIIDWWELVIRTETVVTVCTTLAGSGGGGGVPGARPPMGPNSFIFTYIFAKKCLCRRSTLPPNGSTPPYGKSWIRHCTMFLLVCFVAALHHTFTWLMTFVILSLRSKHSL